MQKVWSVLTEATNATKPAFHIAIDGGGEGAIFTVRNYVKINEFANIWYAETKILTQLTCRISPILCTKYDRNMYIYLPFVRIGMAMHARPTYVRYSIENPMMADCTPILWHPHKSPACVRVQQSITISHLRGFVARLSDMKDARQLRGSVV